MKRLLCQNDQIVILNAAFLSSKAFSLEEIVAKFTLPVAYSSFHRQEIEISSPEMFNCQVYDLFYQPDKKQLIQRFFSANNKNQLIADLEFSFSSMISTQAVTKRDLLQSIHQYFSHAVIESTKQHI